MKHLKKGCPLPVEMIDKKRRQFTLEARTLFAGLHMDGVAPHLLIRETVTARTILFMNKFRNQTMIDDHVTIEDCPEDIDLQPEYYEEEEE